MAYFQDPDVGNASYNFSTAVLPFSLVAALVYNYNDLTFTYPPTEFSTPFAPAPGYEAIQFLRGLSDSGGTRIAVWGNSCSGCGVFNDPVGVQQMYRVITGRLLPQDGSCNSNPATLHTCLALQTFADTRFYSSTGPVDLAPGHSVLVAVAMLYAAPLAQWAATSNGLYSMPAGALSSYIGGANGSGGYRYYPGFPASPDSMAVYRSSSSAAIVLETSSAILVSIIVAGATSP